MFDYKLVKTVGYSYTIAPEENFFFLKQLRRSEDSVRTNSVLLKDYLRHVWNRFKFKFGTSECRKDHAPHSHTPSKVGNLEPNIMEHH